jgi:LEA14-like dessication related protein
MKMARLKSLRYAVLAALLVLTGCGSVYKAPQVTLQNVQLGGLGLTGGTLLVNLRVMNPNRFALNADQLEYTLSIREPGSDADTTWLNLASGTYDEPFSVRSGETKDIRIPVEFSYAGLGGASSALLRNGTFTYRANGTVDVRTPLGTHNVPFQKRGTVTLLGTQ